MLLMFSKVTQAGTETKPQINQDAVRLIKQLYEVALGQTQHSKLLEDIPSVDIVVTMGNNVQCPFWPASIVRIGGGDDPSGMDDNMFLETIALIQDKILDLGVRIKKTL